MDYAEEFMFLVNTSQVKLALTPQSAESATHTSRKSTRGGTSKEKEHQASKIACHVGNIVDADEALSLALATFVEDESARLSISCDARKELVEAVLMQLA